jgi:hypothetical protein
VAGADNVQARTMQWGQEQKVQEDEEVTAVLE